jgi:hypothetical protein
VLVEEHLNVISGAPSEAVEGVSVKDGTRDGWRSQVCERATDGYTDDDTELNPHHLRLLLELF